jgi:uncharacterized protein YprB with RNaseH-like and TPR domain
MASLEYTDSLPKFMQGLANLKRAGNRQYEWLYSHGCSHHHRYTTHFSCFMKEFSIKEKIGFLDIETSNLKANFGIVLCWCIEDEKGDIYEDWVTLEDIKKGFEDRRIVGTCIETMKSFDRIVTHYGTYFDVPFLRTRSLIHGLMFPEYGELYHTDVWKMAKKSLCLHSNRQDCVAEALQGKTIKTRIDHPAWRKATYGDQAAMKEVVDHCEKDVPDLKKNFYSLLPFNKLVNSSI